MQLFASDATIQIVKKIAKEKKIAVANSSNQDRNMEAFGTMSPKTSSFPKYSNYSEVLLWTPTGCQHKEFNMFYYYFWSYIYNTIYMECILLVRLN
jgi:hypothetical protein